MVSKIEQIISEIEDFIDSCKYATFSSTKILVDKEEIDELLQELKKHTPDEIMRCQKILSNRDAILVDAKTKADKILSEAQNFSDQMVSEHEIMQQAYAQAGEIVDQAKMQAKEMLENASEQAQNIQLSALQYTDDSLANIQNILSASIEETQAHNNQLVNSLSEILNVVNNNRAELHPDEELAMDYAIAERAEAERMMTEGESVPETVEEEIPAVAPEGTAVNNAVPASGDVTPVQESGAQPQEKASMPDTPVSESDIPLPIPMGGAIRRKN